MDGQVPMDAQNPYCINAEGAAVKVGESYHNGCNRCNCMELGGLCTGNACQDFTLPKLKDYECQEGCPCNCLLYTSDAADE